MLITMTLTTSLFRDDGDHQGGEGEGRADMALSENNRELATLQHHWVERAVVGDSDRDDHRTVATTEVTNAQKYTNK